MVSHDEILTLEAFVGLCGSLGLHIKFYFFPICAKTDGINLVKMFNLNLFRCELILFKKAVNRGTKP